MVEECINVQLEEEGLRKTCRRITARAARSWRGKGYGNAQISHVIRHPFPAIPREFASQKELAAIQNAAEKKLGTRIRQIDGIRRDGLVNVLTEQTNSNSV